MAAESGIVHPKNPHLWKEYNQLAKQTGRTPRGHWLELTGKAESLSTDPKRKTEKLSTEQKAVQVFGNYKNNDLILVHFEGFNQEKPGNVNYSLWHVTDGETRGDPYFSNITEVKVLGSEADRILAIQRLGTAISTGMNLQVAPIVSLVMGYLSNYYAEEANIFSRSLTSCVSVGAVHNFVEINKETEEPEKSKSKWSLFSKSL